VEQAEVEKLVGELEVAVDRLRSLYEQYFMGIEKLEPTVPRKDVDRRIHVLRKEQVRNTALRFRFQMILQRYNTYQTHWQRICREIENGTYKRHLARAQKRFGDDARLLAPARAAGAAPGTPVLDRQGAAELAELDREFAADDEAIEEVDVEPEEETRIAPPRAPGPAPASRPPAVSGGAPAATPAAARGAASAAPPGSPAAPKWRKAAPAPARSPEPEPAPAPAPGRAPGPTPARPPAPAPASPAAPISPAVRSPFAAPAGARPPAPAAGRGPAPAPARRDDLPEERLRQLYSQYVETKRRHNESTAAITYEAVAKSLRDSSAKLREKHGKTVDFEVSVKDGKTILKPVLK